jgi:hypothetical protein
MPTTASALRLVAVLAGLVCAVPARAEAETLQERLGSKDPTVARAAVAEVLAGAERADPLSLMHAASRHFELGAPDEAVLWFYAGQLRARYAPHLIGEHGQIVTIYSVTLGEAINAYAMQDILKMIEIIAKAMRWDETTYETWAMAHKLDPLGEKLLQRRTAAREGLVTFATDLTRNREKYEKAARAYKSPEQLRREAEESVRRDYTTAPLERIVGGRTLRIPANYVTAHGLAARPRETARELTLVMFLPKLVGYTLDNWRDLTGNKDVMWVRVKPDSGPRPGELIEAFIASEPPATPAYGATAYHFDSRTTTARLPVQGSPAYTVVAATDADGDPIYMMCQAPDPGTSIKPAPRCELFATDPALGLRVHAQFFREHAPQWRKIQAQLTAFLKSWLVTE